MYYHLQTVQIPTAPCVNLKKMLKRSENPKRIKRNYPDAHLLLLNRDLNHELGYHVFHRLCLLVMLGTTNNLIQFY